MAPVFKDANDFTATASDTGTTPPSTALETELSTLESAKTSSAATFFGTRLKNGGGYTGSSWRRARDLAATLAQSIVSPTATQATLERLRAAQARAWALLN